MKQRGSYPKDISIIAAIFIIAILLIAAMNLFVSFELRREYFKSEQDKILSIIKLFTNNMETIIDQVELHGQNKIIMRIFNIEHLIITDTLKNMIYDSWPTPLSVSIKPVDYDILFKRLPGSDELLQNGDNLLYR